MYVYVYVYTCIVFTVLSKSSHPSIDILEAHVVLHNNVTRRVFLFEFFILITY